MREILFRGKRIDNGSWVEGAFCGKDSRYPLGPIEDIPNIIKYDKPFEGFWYEVDLSTVGQYVGLTDKNGKKIFEGDIVSGYFNHKKVQGVITYGSDATFYIHRDGLYGIGLNNATDWLEVIGNIHDNPELWKEFKHD